MNRKSKLGMVFQPEEQNYLATLSLKDLPDVPNNLEQILHKASRAYDRRIKRMRELAEENQNLRRKRTPTPAVLMWDLGDEIFKLIEDLDACGVEIEDLYYHLTRDIGISKSTLKRVVAVRRYIPERITLPINSKWSFFKGAPKKYARKR